MFVTNWISTTKIQKISEITNFFRHYFLSRTEVYIHCLLREFLPNKNYKRLFSSLPAPVPLYLLRLALKLYVTCKEMLRV